MLEMCDISISIPGPKKQIKVVALLLLVGLAIPIGTTDTRGELLYEVPSIGMYLIYRMNTVINGVPFPPAQLTVTYGEFQDPHNQTIITTLTVRYELGWISGTENGTIVENVTSRRLTRVDVPPDGLLEILYGIYFDQSQPNFTPFWIHPENTSMGSCIKAFNVSFSVEDDEFEFSSHLGKLNTWYATAYRTNASIVYNLALFYEKTLGILVGGKIWINWEQHSRSYNETIHLIETNVGLAGEPDENIEEAINRSWLGIYLIASIPFVLVAFRFLGLRKLKGGLD